MNRGPTAPADQSRFSRRSNVEDLYLELAHERAERAQRTVGRWPSPTALAQGADCLVEAAAHLRVAARRPGDEACQRRRMTLAQDLLETAAELDREGDTLAVAGSFARSAE